jgi:hypothetical protein
MHVFTCHFSPSAAVAGSWSGALSNWLTAARERQVTQFVRFVESFAPTASPAIVAGDFNLSLKFAAGSDVPAASQHALQLLVALETRCGLKEASAQLRGRAEPTGSASDPIKYFKPTFGYIGGDSEGGPPEVFLSTYGDGAPRRVADDAVFYRGLDVVDLSEESLCIPEEARPSPRVTHVSDHWAVLAGFR